MLEIENKELTEQEFAKIAPLVGGQFFMLEDE